MHLLYNWLLRILTPLVLLRLVWRGFKNHAYWRRWPERFAFGLNLPQRKRIWIHAVSVGEVRAAIPLVRELRDLYPDHAILITTMTPTGSGSARTSAPRPGGSTRTSSHSWTPVQAARPGGSPQRSRAGSAAGSHARAHLR